MRHRQRPGREVSEAPGGRAQIVVVAALLIAVIFVGLALTLNSAIYAENLASRDVDTGSGDAQIHQERVEADLVLLLDETNTGTPEAEYSDLLARFEADLDAHRRSNGNGEAIRGGSLDYRLDSAVRGMRLRQTNESRDFTDKNGNWNWSLTDDVPDGGQFTMNLQTKSLYEATLDTTMAALADSAFGVEFHLADYDGEGDGVWRIYFFQGAATDNVYAIVERPNETFEGNSAEAVSGFLDQACQMKGGSLTVRLGQSTLGGIHCEMFEFYGDIETHDVSFVNARTESVGGEQVRARGTYDVLVRNSTVNVDAFHDPGGGQPVQQSAIYTVTYSMSYRTSTIEYTASNRSITTTDESVRGIFWKHPTVDRFDVADVSDAHGVPAFEIDWAVSDRDGDLDRVELYMVSVSNDEVVDEETVALNGPTGDEETTLTDSSLLGALGEEYRLQIVVVDDLGRADAVSGFFVAG